MADSTKDAPKRYVVKAEAAVVFVNTANERYLYRGAAVPETVEAEEIRRLVEFGLIAEAPAV